MSGRSQIVCVGIVALALALGSASAGLASSHISNADVFGIGVGQQPGTSMLVRTRNGVAFSYGSAGHGVFPGHAYTLWFVVFNFPENCIVPYACGEDDIFVSPGPPGTDIFYGAGNVVGGTGTINLGGRVGIRDEGHFPGFGPGFLNPLTAEIHLVLRGHGPKVPANMPAQINSYAGGCEVFLGPPGPPDVADEVGECADVQFSIHFSPDAP